MPGQYSDNLALSWSLDVIHEGWPAPLVSSMLVSTSGIHKQSAHHLWSGAPSRSKSVYKPLAVDCGGLESHG